MNSSTDLLDLRVRRTYKFLWEALVALMTERDFESITVTDICERAMVHRTTFYKHYEDKYGLLYHGIQEQLNALAEAVDSHIDPDGSVMDEASVLSHLTVLFEHILKHEAFYRLMLCGEGVGKFYVLFRRSMAERFAGRPAGHHRPDTGHNAIRAALHSYSHVGALLGSVTWWLENKCPYSSAEMAKYLWEDAFSRTAVTWNGA